MIEKNQKAMLSKITKIPNKLTNKYEKEKKMYAVDSKPDERRR